MITKRYVLPYMWVRFLEKKRGGHSREHHGTGRISFHISNGLVIKLTTLPQQLRADFMLWRCGPISGFCTEGGMRK